MIIHHDQSAGVLHVTIADGSLQPEDLLAMRERMRICVRAHPERRRVHIRLLPGAERLGSDEIYALALAVRQEIGSGRVAVSAGADVHYGLGRMVEGVAGGEGLRVAVFRGLAEAWDWLAAEGD